MGRRHHSNGRHVAAAAGDVNGPRFYSLLSIIRQCHYMVTGQSGQSGHSGPLSPLKLTARAPCVLI